MIRRLGLGTFTMQGLPQLKAACEGLDFLYSEQEASSRSSFWLCRCRRPSLAWRKHRKIKHLISVLEKFRKGEEWKYVETSVFDVIKEVNNSTGDERTDQIRESEKNKIVQLLLGMSSNTITVPVVSIFGDRGIGKSKLAEAIFEDSSIVDEFGSSRFWVNVAEEFHDVKNIVTKIIECILQANIRTGELSLDTLRDLLVKLTFKKKFLLVLDDFSSEETESWDELMQCLMWGSDRSRVIVVTHKESIADRISTLEKYRLQGLNDVESLASWGLDWREGVELNELKQRILSKCGQNPLHVEVVGKVIRYRPRGTDIFKFIRELGGELFGSDSSALQMGYSFLPQLLQKCFLYCGLFPRGKDIDVEKLIHHWMAQQYIIRPEGAAESMEEIGLEYFKYLVRRSLLIEGKRDKLGNVTTCKLDDAIHDTASTLAAGLGHRVVKAPKEKEKMEEFNDIQTRHVSFPFHFNSKLTDKCSFNAQRLRTFLLPEQDIMKSNEGQLPGIVRSSFVFGSSFPFIFENSFSQDMLTRFKELYVCDLHSSGIIKVPSCIQKLECLRYLDISDNDEIKFLPKAITKLHYLQVLNVSGCEMLEKLPKKIRMLINLRHLYCHRCWNLKYMPSGIGKLTELRTLSWFVVAEDSSLFAHIGGLEELEGLVNLREVEIINLKHLKGEDSEFQKAKINDKKHLQSLTLCWNHDEDDKDNTVIDVVLDLQSNENLQRLKVRDYKGLTFPIEFSLLKNLVHISIKNCATCVNLPPLDHIETLKFLSIKNLPCLVYIDYNSDMFKSLIQLRLLNCPNLKGWSKGNDLEVVGMEYFESVSLAEIKDCPKFNPEFPKANDKTTIGNDTGQLSQFLLQRKQHRKRLNVKRAEAVIRDIIQTDPGNAKTRIEAKGSMIIEDVEYFPEELLKNMSSFRKLHINNCPELSSLPEALKYSTTLQELEISGCPRLEVRFFNRNGALWPIVEHIPYIQVSGEYLKYDGEFQSNLMEAPVPDLPKADMGRRIRSKDGPWFVYKNPGS